MPPFACHMDQKLSKMHRCLAIHQEHDPTLPIHREVMAFLKPFYEHTHFRVPYRDTREFLTLMLRAGCLFLNGRQIIPDLYGRAELSVRVEKNPLVISGWVETKGKGFYLHQCDFMCAGPPHWIVKGCSLKFLDTELSWQQLKRAFGQTLTLQDVDEDLGEDPLPMLKLVDRSGAFANLWLDYHEERIAYHDPRPGRKRRIDVEKGWERDLLETDFVKKQVDSSHYYCPMDKVAKSLTFLLELGWQIFDHQGKKVVKYEKVDFVCEHEDAIILVKGKIRYEEHEVDLKDVVGAFNRKEHFVSIDSMQVGLLPEGNEASALHSLVDEGEVVTEGVQVHRHSIGGLESIAREEPSLQELIEPLISFQGFPKRTPSDHFEGTLRPYQQDGVNWLAFLYEHHFHGLLADEMGLGKTVQVLAFLSQLPPEGPCLIVMPTTLLFNWKQEIERFLPKSRVVLYHVDEREACFDQNTLVLTSYATLRRDLPLFVKTHFQCVVLDEAQAIKNVKTQNAQAVYQLQTRFRLSLSGTPIENREEELWSHFHFLMPQLLGKEEYFRTCCVTAGSQRIKKKIRPFILRRKKSEVAQDLPEKIEQLCWIEMEEEQRIVYDQFLKGIKNNLLQKVSVDGSAKHRMEMFEAILRLRQICCHPLLTQSTSVPSAKLEVLLTDIQTIVEEGHKILVYSQFTSMLKLIGKEVHAMHIPYVYLDGSTKNREQVVKQFQEDADMPVFLMSLKAGGVGLNLTAADYVFIYDPWWNDAVENQAINRAHRIGQHNVVIAKRYVMAESIEEKMLKLKEKKRMTADRYIDDHIAHDHLTDEDLKALLT